MNRALANMKALEGRTIATVQDMDVELRSGYVITCTDGYELNIWTDYDGDGDIIVEVSPDSTHKYKQV